MNNHVTLKTARARLDGMGMHYRTLDLKNGYTALVTQYGGRLIGPFKGEEGESILWLNKVFLDEAAFRRFVEGRAWNLGGERLWINPELKFFCQTPETFDQTYTVQPQLDPGAYELRQSGGGVALSQDVMLSVLETGEKKSFHIDRRYFPAANPLAFTPLRDAAIDYCGFTQDIRLRDDSDFPLALEPWTLTQINPEGRVVTPFFGDFDFVDYYDPAGACQQVRDGYAELMITGRHKYKVAYRSAQTCGRMGFVKRTGGGWHLMVRNYYNDPSIPYLSEPWGNLGDRGCSAYYYNDHGQEDGFAEFEHSGTAIGAQTGRTESTSTSSLWFFFGTQEEIARVMKLLLGIDYRFDEGMRHD